MLKHYEYLYFLIYSSINKSGGLDPPYSTVIILCFFELVLGFCLLVISELVLRNRIHVFETIYILVGTGIILFANILYFFYKKRYVKIISNDYYARKKLDLKWWQVVIAMLISIFVFAFIILLRLEFLGS